MPKPDNAARPGEPPPQIAQFVAALEETQYLAVDNMRAYQRRLLSVLLRHARSETSFYADRLSPVFGADDSVDWDRWEEIPVLTRKAAQENFTELTARNLPEAAGRRLEDTTSGSTGVPFHHYTTALQNVGAVCANERFYRWHQLDPQALAAMIHATSDPEAVYPGGRAVTWRVGRSDSRGLDLSVQQTPVAQQVEWLRRIRPDYLVSYPTNLREIARVAGGGGPHIDVRGLLTIGEMLSDDTRSAIRGYFGLDPLDRYGSTEVGHIAATCPHSLKLHVSAEMVLIEILNEHGAAVRPGTTGRIVATPFYSLAMPLIRYDTGDYGVMAKEACGCGRTLPLLDRVLGRARNIFRFADGTSVWPVVRSREIGKFVPHRQYQLVQVALDRLELRHVPVAAQQVNDLQGLTAHLRATLHPSLAVTVVEVGEIKRSPGGKYEDCLSLLV
jgi:phenylacetate-CoA ligase